MNVSRLFKSIKHHRNFCSTFREELTVQTFCDIHIEVPYNVKIKPLDVHKYHNCDLLTIETTGTSNKCAVKHIQDGNNIKIFSSTSDYNQDVTCNIQAPVKANLKISALGSIFSGVFGGSKLLLFSKKGSVFVDKFSGDVIDVKTVTGDIVLKGPVLASDINLSVGQLGKIKTKRLQGLNAKLKTNEGDISVESSYCDTAVFESNHGLFNLQNIHKNCEIVLRSGQLNLSGLDGHLTATLTDTDAEIQISRILQDSVIDMSGSKELRLLLSDECQRNTQFEIYTKNYEVDPSVSLVRSKTENILYLTPISEQPRNVIINCKSTKVHVQSASWFNMLKLKE